MSRQIALKEAEGPTVEVTHHSPLQGESAPKVAEFDLSNSLSLTMFIMTVQLALMIPKLVAEIEREQKSLPPNVITADFHSEMAVTVGSTEAARDRVLSLKELVRRSMGELNLNDPNQYVYTLVTALIKTFQAGEATVVTY